MDTSLVRRYRSLEGAAAYRVKYEKSWIRRLSNRRELAIVDAAVARAGASPGAILDCPCGAGRLQPVLRRHAARVFGADLSRTMVEQARDALAGGRTLLTAGASALPFADGSFDVVVCHRLIHHVTDGDERARILAELARVARGAVVLSFADARTFKAGRLRARGSLCAMLSESDLAREAAGCGLRLEPPCLRIGGWFSVQAVSVLRKIPVHGD